MFTTENKNGIIADGTTFYVVSRAIESGEIETAMYRYRVMEHNEDGTAEVLMAKPTDTEGKQWENVGFAEIGADEQKDIKSVMDTDKALTGKAMLDFHKYFSRFQDAAEVLAFKG